MRENINSNFYIPLVKYTYTTLPVNFQRNQITDNTITSSRSNKSMTHFPPSKNSIFHPCYYY